MHHIYTTEGIILKREPSDTSAAFVVLTRELGLIRARAQGVRKHTSRLSGALQTFSLATISFVRAKNGWKLTTAIPERNFWNDTRTEEARKVLSHISATCSRFISNDEKDEYIFMLIKNACMALAESEKNVSVIEALVLARLLHILGYVATDGLEEFFSSVDFSVDMLDRAITGQNVLVRAVNRAFKESQL